MASVLVIGSTNVDLIGVATGSLQSHDSNPGRIEIDIGGVGKNIAENLKHLGADVHFLTFLGNDEFTPFMENYLHRLDLNYSHSFRIEAPSGTYLAVHHSDGSLETGINDLSLIERVGIADFEPRASYIGSFDWLVIDANLPEFQLDWLCTRFSDHPIAMDGVSRFKAVRLKNYLKQIRLLKVNLSELSALVDAPITDVIQSAKTLLDSGLKSLIITAGGDPITYNIGPRIFQTPVQKTQNVRSTVGCGDALLAATIFGLIIGKTMHEAIDYGKRAAALTMEVDGPCHPFLSFNSFKD